MYSTHQPQELIPRTQPIKPPHHDHPISLSTFKHSPVSTSAANNIPHHMVEREEHNYIVQQLNKAIQHLKHRLQAQRQQQQLQTKANTIYHQLFHQLKNIFQTDDITHIIQSITSLKNQRHLLNTILQQSKQLQTNLKQEIHISHQKIQQLRIQLLRSSQNNISTIFNSTPSPQSILQHINILYQSIYTLKSNLQLPKQPTHSIQQLYHAINHNHQSIHQTIDKLHSNQAQMKQHFDVIQDEIKYIVEQQKDKLGKQIDNRQIIKQLQLKFINLIDSLTTPQIAKNQVYDSFQVSINSDLLLQVRILSDKIKQAQQQIQNYQHQNIILQNQLKQLEFIKSSLKDSFQRGNKLENQIKIKNKRIVELENTIIDHIQSQVSKQKNKYNIETKHQINLERIQHMLTNSRRSNQLLHKQIQQASQLRIEKTTLIFRKVLESLNDLKQTVNTQIFPLAKIKTTLNLIIQNLNNSLSQFFNQQSYTPSSKKIIFHKKNIK